MNEEIEKYLFDIVISINAINEYLGDKRDFIEYQKNRMKRKAVERELEIIGEAMNRILKINPEINITSAKQIVSMRNRVIHGYDNIDDGIIWGTINRHLPLLKIEIDKLNFNKKNNELKCNKY